MSKEISDAESEKLTLLPKMRIILFLLKLNTEIPAFADMHLRQSITGKEEIFAEYPITIVYLTVFPKIRI